MKLLLFGGTFDPPHFGHMRILENAINTVAPAKVMVMVAGIPPHKQNNGTPAKLRLEMANCFKTLFKNLEVSDLEINRPEKSYTIDTVKTLKKQMPNAEICLCIGSDMLIEFKTWQNWQELLGETSLVVQSRKQEDTEKLKVAANELRILGANIIFVKGEFEEISSTEIRKKRKNSEDVSKLLPKNVNKLILENKLYLFND